VKISNRYGGQKMTGVSEKSQFKGFLYSTIQLSKINFTHFQALRPESFLPRE